MNTCKLCVACNAEGFCSSLKSQGLSGAGMSTRILHADWRHTLDGVSQYHTTFIRQAGIRQAGVRQAANLRSAKELLGQGAFVSNALLRAYNLCFIYIRLTLIGTCCFAQACYTMR